MFERLCSLLDSVPAPALTAEQRRQIETEREYEIWWLAQLCVEETDTLSCGLKVRL